MTYDRKLMRNGNGWALCLNSLILQFLDVDPTKNMVRYTMENDKLIITKSDKMVKKEKEK